jgi:hypothetical protein
MMGSKTRTNTGNSGGKIIPTGKPSALHVTVYMNPNPDKRGDYAMRSALFQAHRERQQASVNAQWLYSELVHAIEFERRYELMTAYEGLKIVSIWEAKPVAWRPTPLYQYDFRLPTGVPEPNWKTEGDVLHDYYRAYLLEKDAWAKFTAVYIDAVHEWLRNPEVEPPAENTTGKPNSRVFRIYEVKVA